MRVIDSGVRSLLNSSIRLSASGPVGAGTAWHRYQELDLWPRWAPQVQAVRCSADRLTAGAFGRVFGPLGLHVDFTVLEVDDASSCWTWEVRRGPVGVLLEHGIEPDGPTGATAWLVLRGPLPLLLGYAPAAWYALHRLVTLPDLDGGT